MINLQVSTADDKAVMGNLKMTIGPIWVGFFA